MKFPSCALALVLAAATAPTLAQGEPEKSSRDTEFNRKGWYAGMGAAWGKDLFEEDIEGALKGVVDVTDTWGLNARLGYRLRRWFAFEVQWEWMDNFQTTIADASDTEIASFTTHTITANAKILLLRNKVQPYFLLGAGGQYGDFKGQTVAVPAAISSSGQVSLPSSSSWDFAGRLGGGVDIYFNKNVLMNVEAAVVGSAGDFGRPGREIEDILYLSVGGGFQYRW